MENKIQVANYTATLTRELYRMCHKAGLTDLAYLLEVAAEEASKDSDNNRNKRHSAAKKPSQGCAGAQRSPNGYFCWDLTILNENDQPRFGGAFPLLADAANRPWVSR